MTEELEVTNDPEVVACVIKDMDTCSSINYVFNEYEIGSHVSKAGGLAEVLEKLDPKRPYQIFFTSHKINFQISNDEIIKCKSIVDRKKLRIFVHTPYLINLATDKPYIVSSLQQHLTTAAQCGFKGCVVHVGKSCKQDLNICLENMRSNILKSIEVAIPECPLLLETPAKQGTEMLTTFEEFTDFIFSINDARLGICVDTCHVFSAGYMPTDYVGRLTNKNNGLAYLKLIHFNDSEKECNSCLDRHALFGTGKIPVMELLNIAFMAQNNDIPMVIE